MLLLPLPAAVPTCPSQTDPHWMLTWSTLFEGSMESQLCIAMKDGMGSMYTYLSRCNRLDTLAIKLDKKVESCLHAYSLPPRPNLPSISCEATFGLAGQINLPILYVLVQLFHRFKPLHAFIPSGVTLNLSLDHTYICNNCPLCHYMHQCSLRMWCFPSQRCCSVESTLPHSCV